MDAIPCTIMRGGTSRGPFFHASDLPASVAERDRVLLDVMGSPHELQVDGIGGAQPQTSKVAIISPSERPGIDVEYLFAQVNIEQAVVDTKPNCGNMLSAVGPFALENGLVPYTENETSVMIYNVNTQARVEARIETPGGRVNYAGDLAIAGVPGTGAPIKLTFYESIGSVTGKLFPSEQNTEVINGVSVTLIDNAMPMMLVAATGLGLTGTETPEALDGDRDLLDRLEAIRLIAGERMGLGDVSERVVPKVGILSAPVAEGTITSRYLMPWKAHRSHAVTGAVCLASAACVRGTVASGIVGDKAPGEHRIQIEHPSGVIDVEIETQESEQQPVVRASLLRTARRVMKGEVYLTPSI